MTHDVLGGEDAAWLHMEDETNPMVVNGVLELAERLAVERIHTLLERVAAIGRFRARVVEPALHAGPPHWEDVADFDLAQHIEHVTLASPDDATLQAFVGGAVSGLLDRARPMWRVYVIDRPSRGTTLLYRVHHAIADGFALLGILLSLCDGGELPRAATPRPPRRTRVTTAVACARSLARVVTLPSDPKTLLKGALSREKRVAWSEPIALADVKSAAHAASATVNDVLVATATGALGRYLARAGQPLDDLEIRAMVPVDLRGGAAPTDLGNRFGLVVLALPVCVRDPSKRLAAVKQRMDRLKGTPEALVTHGLLRAMGWAPRPVEDLGAWFFGTKASIVLTNVPGPRTRLSLAGVPVSRIMFWVPQSGRMGLGISILSYAGTVTIGILADAALVPDPGALAADLHVELRALQAELGGASVSAEAQRATITPTSRPLASPSRRYE
jgi:diacylglycerol O-acyltransferase / wax synthase